MASSVEALADSLRTGKTVFSAWCGLPEPSITGILAREEGLGCITLDMQHGAPDLLTVIRSIPLVAAAGKPCVARIPVGEFATASRILDAGASGIIAPMVNTVEDARTFASFTKFPPIGQRSWGPLPALSLTGLAPPAYFKGANDFVRTFAMIETREALNDIDAIMAVDGIDGIFIGPSDLSIGLSNGATLAPTGQEVNRAIEHALARARDGGKLAGIYAPTGERAREFAGLGYHFVALGSDISFLRVGAAAMLKAAAG